VSGESQLGRWAGDFGRSYTDRNAVDWRSRERAFRTMLDGLAVESVLEVGCNRGHNLVAIESVARPRRLAGVEPNPYALELARAALPAAELSEGRADKLPFDGREFDLVFTAGVLIHVPPETLDGVLREIVRVARRYVLAVEYFAEQEEVVRYREHDDLLWKRDFRRAYERVATDLRLVRSGFWGPDDGFDDATWWLLERVDAG
jgi:pseudaminic acid biosynthesis-associated methylase